MNPSTPQNLYQQYQKKPPASYEDTVDPYRRHKSQPSDSNSTDQENLHSRTASDSSSSRLAVNGAPYSHGLSTREYDDDPYRPLHHTNNISSSNNNSVSNKRVIPTTSDAYLRANSYLPYSHHQRDPAQPIAPIYVEDDQQQTFQGVGSMLQDNFSMDITQSDIQRPKTSPNIEKHDMEVLEQNEKKRRRRRYCGLTLRIWLCLVTCFLALFALLMYFLIPRIPTVTFSSADTTQQRLSYDAQTLTAQWIMGFNLDNSDNWIPTWMQKMEVALEDKDTKTQIGWGVLESQWLPARNPSYLVTLPINIAYSSTDLNDETLSDLKTTCGPRRRSPTPTTYQPELFFNATFQIDFYLQGVPRSSRITIVPDDGIQCPS